MQLICKSNSRFLTKDKIYSATNYDGKSVEVDGKWYNFDKNFYNIQQVRDIKINILLDEIKKL